MTSVRRSTGLGSSACAVWVDLRLMSSTHCAQQPCAEVVPPPKPVSGGFESSADRPEPGWGVDPRQAQVWAAPALARERRRSPLGHTRRALPFPRLARPFLGLSRSTRSRIERSRAP
jgi:hypothetical protein